jgi:hypothetical protein
MKTGLPKDRFSVVKGVVKIRNISSSFDRRFPRMVP